METASKHSRRASCFPERTLNPVKSGNARQHNQSQQSTPTELTSRRSTSLEYKSGRQTASGFNSSGGKPNHFRHHTDPPTGAPISIRPVHRQSLTNPNVSGFNTCKIIAIAKDGATQTSTVGVQGSSAMHPNIPESPGPNASGSNSRDEIQKSNPTKHITKAISQTANLTNGKSHARTTQAGARARPHVCIWILHL